MTRPAAPAYSLTCEGGRMAEWLCRGLQILVQRFDSASGLQPIDPGKSAVLWRQRLCDEIEKVRNKASVPRLDWSRVIGSFIPPARVSDGENFDIIPAPPIRDDVVSKDQLPSTWD